MENHFHFQILLLFLHIGNCIACGRAEYLIQEECCPMCAPGNRVHKHCTEYTSTSCIPCMGSTFLDQPNGQTTCFLCTNCDPVVGLKIKQSCTPTSDALCEPLAGYFCVQLFNQGCTFAKEHSSCKPGQYISQQGTSSTDTKCSDCPGDTFSNGSVTACQPFTKCETLGKIQISPGNTSFDTTCGQTHDLGLGGILAGVVGIIFVVIFVVIGVIVFRRRKNTGESNLRSVLKGLLPVQESDSPRRDISTNQTRPLQESG